MSPTNQVLKLEKDGKLIWFSPVSDDLTIDELLKTFRGDQPIRITLNKKVGEVVPELMELARVEKMDALKKPSIFKQMVEDKSCTKNSFPGITQEMIDDDIYFGAWKTIEAYERGWCL